MITLGIETSCDETSVAIIDGLGNIRANIVSSSLFRHQEFGGVVPEIASRHSLEQIDFVLKEALKQASCELKDIELIAVTKGPGLIGSLLVGVSFAKSLSFALGVPLVGVNHLEAHLVANFMQDIGQNREVPVCPEEFLGLLVSGGHTMITLHKKGEVEILGETTDDAVGEAYDKVGKMLGLGFPGGPAIDRLAKQGNNKRIQFTKPKQKERWNFSYSGIKTAVLYYLQELGLQPGDLEISTEIQQDVAACFQEAAISWLVEKSLDAALEVGMKTIVVGGGVSANSYLREKLTEEAAKLDIQVCFPPLSLSGDNGAMIAQRGLELYQLEPASEPLNLKAYPNLALGQKG